MSRSAFAVAVGRLAGCARVIVLLPALLVSMNTVLAGQESSLPSLADGPDPVTPAEPLSALELSRELERRHQAMEQLQGELGHYDPALVEMHDDLAGFYQEVGDLEQAIAQYRQALQLARINFGLNSEEQLAYIEKIIDCSLSLNDWQQADEMHHLQFYLKDRVYEPADPRFAHAVAELGDWKLRVLRENLLGEGYRRIGRKAEELSEIYRNGIARIQESPDYSETALVPLYQGKSLADLEFARMLADTPYQFFEGTVPQYITQTICRNVNSGREGVVRQCTNVRRENPLYRDSQRNNKRMMVFRSVREAERSIDSINQIMARNPGELATRWDSLASDIRALETEFQRIQINSRRGLLY